MTKENANHDRAHTAQRELLGTICGAGGRLSTNLQSGQLAIVPGVG